MMQKTQLFGTKKWRGDAHEENFSQNLNIIVKWCKRKRTLHRVIKFFDLSMNTEFLQRSRSNFLERLHLCEKLNVAGKRALNCAQPKGRC